jgi:hypothetical protein
MADNDFGGIDAFAKALFGEALVPFELSSALLMVAVIGAVAVARGEQAKKVPKVDTRLTGGRTQTAEIVE